MARLALSISSAFLILLLFPASLAAQQRDPMFYKEVLLPRKPYTLYTLTREMQRQTGITFSYNAANIRAMQKIRIRQDRLTVQKLLALVRKKTGVGYAVIGGKHIIYLPPARGRKRKKAVSAQKKEEKFYRQELAAAQRAPVKRLATLPATDSLAGDVVVVGDSTLAAGYYISGGGNAGGSYQGNDMTVEAAEEEDPYEDISDPWQRESRNWNAPVHTEALEFIKKSTLAAFSLSADEMYYLGPGFRAGFDFLYGTVTYHIGSYTHWRYGIGISAGINERWRLHLHFNTGKNLNASYTVPRFDTTFVPQPDSTLLPVVTEHHTPLLVQSRLSRIAVSAEWHINRSFSLAGALVFNMLHTRYTSNGNPVTLSEILPIGYDADLRYRSLNPPYTLGNSYSGNTTSNTKTWIGLQLTLSYRIPFFER